jgi:hypothetical protein
MGLVSCLALLASATHPLVRRAARLSSPHPSLGPIQRQIASLAPLAFLVYFQIKSFMFSLP